MREQCCCFTGHRPDKLEWGEEIVRGHLERAIEDAITRGFTTFLTGMAMGTDIWAAEIVLEKKKTNPALRLFCALPHPGFERRRSAEEQRRFCAILQHADGKELVCDHYFTGCYQVRNKWMVDRSALVIAVFNGQKGGSKNTIDYATRQGVEVCYAK